MKILEISPFSEGICGVWSRVLSESKELQNKGHKIHIFSSNIIRGTNEKNIANNSERIGDIEIKRFSTFGQFGDNTFFWNFKKEALNLKPDLIITHVYRQYYSTKALKIARKLSIPCVLVTHAPFLDKKLRNWKLNLGVFIYDSLIGKKILKKYSKIFTITKWEVPYLLKLGCKKNQLFYSPNGIPIEFFTQKKLNKTSNKILFLGRVARIKDLETLIKAGNILKDKFSIDIIGPVDEEYKKELRNLIANLNLKNINFIPPVYNLKEKIKIIDEYEIFILPSKREAMPQSLIEAMARQKIVISSKTEGAKEIIQEGKNGFLFDIGDEYQLADIILKVRKMNKNKKESIQKKAYEDVKKFSWSKLIQEIEKILRVITVKTNI